MGTSCIFEKTAEGTVFFFFLSAILFIFSRHLGFLIITISASDFKEWEDIREIVENRELDQV